MIITNAQVLENLNYRKELFASDLRKAKQILASGKFETKRDRRAVEIAIADLEKVVSGYERQIKEVEAR